ncbi:MAG TPA: hypothetical protein VK325_05190 [Pseudoxanthomonas sp.]|nr:hypothetical protein [Pseudoxanthomonas sp.]
MNTNAQRATVLALLVALMATRLHLPTAATHFGPIPDGSWAVFFIGGFYLRQWTRWAFPALMALAVLIDFVVIRSQGLDFLSHYCMSAAYWFLVPAYLALWLGGALAARHRPASAARALLLLAGALVASAAACHLLSQGSFYWLGDSVIEPTVAGWWKNYSDWFIPYLRTTAIYVGLALIVHVSVVQAMRLQAVTGTAR